jgi:hypothetical protein
MKSGSNVRSAARQGRLVRNEKRNNFFTGQAALAKRRLFRNYPSPVSDYGLLL